MGLFARLFKRRHLAGVDDGDESSWVHSKGVKVDRVGSASDTYGRSHPITKSCVQRIVSRALDIPISLPADVADRPFQPWLDWRQFWRQVFEAILYDGVAYIYKEADGRLNLAITCDANSEGTYTLSVCNLNGDVVPVRATYEDVAVIGWDGDCTCPSDLIKTEMQGYKESADDLKQQAQYERRFAAEFELNKQYSKSDDELESRLQDLTSALTSRRKYQFPFIGYGVNFQPRNFGSSPPHRERHEVTTACIARVYGVPLHLMQIGQGGRMSIEELEANLLRDAVMPLIKDVVSALSRIYKEEVAIDEWRIALPTKTGISGLMMTLGQTGAVTINEMRELAGLEEVEGGDELPQTAGAAERETPEDDSQEPEDDEDDEDETDDE